MLGALTGLRERPKVSWNLTWVKFPSCISGALVYAVKCVIYSGRGLLSRSQLWAAYCPEQKNSFSWVHFFFFSYSFLLWFIMGYWIQFPVLYSRGLFIHPIYNSLHLLIPNSQTQPSIDGVHYLFHQNIHSTRAGLISAIVSFQKTAWDKVWISPTNGRETSSCQAINVQRIMSLEIRKMIPLINALMLLNQEIVQPILALSKSRIGKKIFSLKKILIISS